MFMDYIMDSTKALIVDIDKAMEGLGRLAEVDDKDNLNPKLAELAEWQEAHDSRRPLTIKAKRTPGQLARSRLPARLKDQQPRKTTKQGSPD